MSSKAFAPAAERNAQPILGVLRNEFSDTESVFEIGSGTGQHAVFFAAALPQLEWQPSDVEENLHSIGAWVREAALANVRDPLPLDVLATADIPAASYDGVFTANTAHIMSFTAVKKMFAIAAQVLDPVGIFVLYGPIRQDGKFNTPSNAAFHESLRRGDPKMGIRDLGDLDRLAEAGDMRRKRLYAMPANNHIVVWQKATK